jgi:hypothetical protein
MTHARQLGHLSQPGTGARLRRSIWVVLCVLLVTGCGIEVPGLVENRVRTLVEEVRPGTELDFSGRTCSSYFGGRAYPYLWRAEGEVEGDSERMLATARKAGERVGWQPYELRSRYQFDNGISGSKGLVLLNESPGGYETEFDPAQAAVALWVRPTHSGISLEAVSSSNCDETTGMSELLDRSPTQHISVSLLPLWTGYQRIALERGLAVGHAATASISEEIGVEGPPFPARAGRRGFDGPLSRLRLVSCTTPDGDTGLQWLGDSITSWPAGWQLAVSRQQQIPEVVERMRRAAGEDWRVTVTGGAMDGSTDWAEFTLSPSRPGSGTPHLNLIAHHGQMVGSNDPTETLTVDGEIRTDCVPPRQQ